jgi:hypothetical protein
MDIKLIIPNNFNEIIENHPKWELDLGKAYSKQNKSGQMQSHIQDNFVLHFFSQENVLCYKVGRMGVLSFYTSFILPDNEVWVYSDDNSKVILPYSQIELKLNPEEYIAKLVLASQYDENDSEGE